MLRRNERLEEEFRRGEERAYFLSYLNPTVGSLYIGLITSYLASPTVKWN